MQQGPGNDGLTVEFYCKFWNQIGPIFVDVLNFGLENGKMSTSQRHGIFTLIAKKGKDKTKLENYRPNKPYYIIECRPENWLKSTSIKTTANIE